MDWEEGDWAKPEPFKDARDFTSPPCGTFSGAALAVHGKIGAVLESFWP